MANVTSISDLIVGNLAHDVTEEQIGAHLRGLFHDYHARPRVFPLYQPRGTGKRQSAVSIAFKGRTKVELGWVIKKVDGTRIESRSSDGNVTSIIEAETIPEDEVILISTAAKPTFDCYFLHGLGGDPFRTFRTWSSSSNGPFYWPADALPESLANAGKLGNFYTFGYDSSFLKQLQHLGYKRARSSSTELKDIESVAETLLESIRENRPADCRRPVYFICHSLGGLVASAATILATDGITLMGSQIRRPSLRLYSHDPERSLIEGIAFFGTPFKGSALATWGQFTLPWLKLAGMKGQHIARLREDDSLVKTMLYYLNALQLRNDDGGTERPKILTFSEGDGMTLMKIKVSKHTTPRCAC